MIDITMKIHENMRIYKNKPEKKPKIQGKQSDYVYETHLDMNLHTGTHMDFPKHMIVDGKTSKDYPIDYFTGSCYVVDASHVEGGITRKDFEHIDPASYEFILFKTKNSLLKTFNYEFVYLSEEAADHLAQFELKGVGIDALGIERNQPGHPTHKALLSKDILIYEGFDFSKVKEGPYTLFAFPMAFEDVEAAPIRGVLK
jgi:arylformamidase